MIKSLRKRFIMVAMCSIFLVLAVIMGTVNIVNYYRMMSRADNMTATLAENDGRFAGVSGDDIGKRKMDSGRNMRRNDLSPETPYETRFFSVKLDREGTVLFSDVDKIAAISTTDAEEYAIKVFQGRSSKGFEDIYRYRMVDSGTDILIIFLNCGRELSMFQSSLLTSVSVSVLGFIAVTVLVIVFSKIVFRPVAESYEKQKQFITDASHEIKTPLTIIDANIEVLEMENGENQWTKSTKNQIKRLASLTQQLITLSRLDEERKMLEKSEFSLSDAVSETVQSFEALAKAQNKQLDIQIEDGIHFFGDEKSIRQMTGILMDNALKYSLREGSICVLLKRKGRKIQLEVFNQTEDIPKGKHDILFERFYRMDTSRNSETGGSGIGLSVARAIVLSHGGKINAYSADGKSLTVVVTL